MRRIIQYVYNCTFSVSVQHKNDCLHSSKLLVSQFFSLYRFIFVLVATHQAVIYWVHTRQGGNPTAKYVFSVVFFMSYVWSMSLLLYTQLYSQPHHLPPSGLPMFFNLVSTSSVDARGVGEISLPEAVGFKSMAVFFPKQGYYVSAFSLINELVSTAA